MSPLAAKLQDAARAGPRLAPADAPALTEAARQAGLEFVRVDLRGVHDKQGLLDAVACALAFPGWFGRNWDALEDCLIDLSWRPASGHVLLLDHCADLAAGAPADLAAAIEVFDGAAQFWRARARPFWALFGGVGAAAGLKPFA